MDTIVPSQSQQTAAGLAANPAVIAEVSMTSHPDVRANANPSQGEVKKAQL